VPPAHRLHRPAAVARKILVHLGLESTGPPLAPAHREADPVEPAPDYDHPDPVSSWTRPLGRARWRVPAAAGARPRRGPRAVV